MTSSITLQSESKTWREALAQRSLILPTRFYIMYKDYELLCRLESHEVPRRIKDNNVMNVLLCNPQQVSVYGIELFCIVAYC